MTWLPNSAITLTVNRRSDAENLAPVYMCIARGLSSNLDTLNHCALLNQKAKISAYGEGEPNLTPKRTQPAETAPDLSTERAYSVLKGQLEKLQELKGRNYKEVGAAEDEWYNLTAKLVMRSFGSGSPNYKSFRMASSAGSYVMQGWGEGEDYARNQDNFQTRLQSYEAVLKSSVAELELDLPDAGIKGVYEPGEEYEFYRDTSACLKLAQREILVIDPYLNAEIFDVYARAIHRTVAFRLLSASVPADVKTLAQKYASGGNFAFRSSNSIHDRVLFADNRVWLTGQSLKDAAKKKPTYIVEHDETVMRGIYESIWKAATVII